MEKIKVDLNIVPTQDSLDDMRSVVFSSKEVNDLLKDAKVNSQEIQQKLGVLFDFATDCEYCKHCPGLNNCMKNNPNLQTKIKIKNGLIESSLTPCKKYLEKISLDQKFLSRDFPLEWLDDSPKDIDQSEARKKAFALFLKSLKKVNGNWIYLYGKERTGASYLSAMMAIIAANKNYYPICYVNSKNEIDALANLFYKDKSKFDDRIYSLFNCKLLVFDEFGTETKNNLVRDQIVLPILEYRKEKGLITIFNSETSIDKVAISYMTSRAGEENARKIKSILKEKCQKEINLGEMSVY